VFCGRVLGFLNLVYCRFFEVVQSVFLLYLQLLFAMSPKILVGAAWCWPTNLAFAPASW